MLFGVPLFQDKNSNNLHHYDNTIKYIFKGVDIIEKFTISKYMSISTQNEFSQASFEELRLADYEKRKTGSNNKFKIKDTSKIILSNGLKEILGKKKNQVWTIPNFKGFGNDDTEKEKNFFENFKDNKESLVNINEIKIKNNQGEGLFGNNNDKIEGVGLFRSVCSNENNKIKLKNLFTTQDLSLDDSKLNKTESIFKKNVTSSDIFKLNLDDKQEKLRNNNLEKNIEKEHEIIIGQKGSLLIKNNPFNNSNGKKNNFLFDKKDKEKEHPKLFIF